MYERNAVLAKRTEDELMNIKTINRAAF